MNKILTTIFAACALTFCACTGDLDQQPHTSTSATAGQVYGSEQGYKQALAKLYASYIIAGQGKGGSDQDMSSNSGQDLLRAYINMQEIPTDEMACTWLSGDNVANLTYMTWDANDPWVADIYYRTYYTITLCNEFLTHATEGAVSGNANMTAYRAEARFLRSLAYWIILDLFGQGPFVDENTGIGSYTPEYYDGAKLFDFIESELLAITADDGTGLLDPDEVEYGHASKGAALALLARLYLNAEVYGAEAHYTECIGACNDILAMNYSLESDYKKLFNADNFKRTNEIIFSLVSDAENTVTWGAMTYLVCGQCTNLTTLGQSPEDYGIVSGWGMFRARGELPELFAGTEDSDQRRLFYTGGTPQWFTGSIDNQEEGWYVEKFSNLTDEGKASSNTVDGGADTDFPFFRLAEVKLTLAEAVLRGGTGATRTQATQAVNDVRQRAFGDDSGNINEAQLTLDFLLAERGRELYWECSRRTDLVRFGRFAGGDYIWQWKGGMLDGVAVDEKYNIYPIPSAELSANPNMKNPLY